jgi:hypothetical protein
MKDHISRGIIRLSIVLMLTFGLFLATISVRAFVTVSMQLDVDQPTTVIGRTVKLTIRLITNETNSIRVDSLICRLDGASIVQTSSFGTPSTLHPNTPLLINVYYRAVSAGTTRILCTVSVTNPANGEQWQTSTSNEVIVIGETRLFMTSYSATQVATVGQTFFIINKFGNRGTTPFTNVYITCWYYGGDVALGGPTSLPPSVLQPGQATFVEQRWVAQHPGLFHMDCSITGTDSSGTEVTVPSPRVTIQVR